MFTTQKEKSEKWSSISEFEVLVLFVRQLSSLECEIVELQQPLSKIECSKEGTESNSRRLELLVDGRTCKLNNAKLTQHNDLD